VARTRIRVESARARVVAARSTVPAIDTAFLAGDRDRKVGGNLLACAVAYRLFLWILPMSLVAVAALGFLVEADRDNPEEVARDVGLSAYVASTVADAADQANEGRWVLLVGGLIALFMASRAGVTAVRAVYARAWGLPYERTPRPLLASLGFTGITLLCVLVTVGGNWARSESDGLGLGVRLAVVVVYAGLWLVCSLPLPRPDGVPWTALLPGVLLLAAGAQALHLATVFYFAQRISSASELYGGLGSAAAVLLWLYLIGRLVVGSAVLNATLWERHRARVSR
jgi:uncharacterized BrkB/YihY/UPF0761 family membrane protein